MDAIKKWIKGITANRHVRFLLAVFQRFGEENGGFYAAGLAFFLLLSFAPLILSGVAVLGFFIDVHTATQKVTEMIQNLLPDGGARDEATRFLTERMHIEDQVRSVIAHRGVAGLIGFLSLIWAAIQIFLNAGVAMDAIWEVKETRNWFLLRAMALGLMVLTGVLLVITLLLSGAPTAIAHFNLPIIHRLPLPLWSLTLLFELFAVVVNTVMYTIVYKSLPNADVSWKSALFGGVIASVLWEIAKKGVAVYLLKANNSVYGDLANLILFVLWIYYSMMILLLGSAFAATFAKQAEEYKARGTARNRPEPKTRGERIRRTARGVSRQAGAR